MRNKITNHNIKNRKDKLKMLSAIISESTLNRNELNILIIREKKREPSIYCLPSMHLKYKDISGLKITPGKR